MAEIRATFFLECDDLLGSLLEGLEELGEDPENSETINAIFRAVHSIKGGAGAFGFDGLVGFSHRFENALVCLRSGTAKLTSDFLSTCFQAADLLSDHVKAAQDGVVANLPMEEQIGRALDQISAPNDSGVSPSPAQVEDDTPAFQPMGLDLGLVGSLDDLAPEDGEDTQDNNPPISALSAADVFRDEDVAQIGLKVIFRPQSALYLAGHDPVHLINMLYNRFGGSVECSTHRLPDLSDIKPDTSYLIWTIRVETVSVTDIVEVFEFVDGLCELEIHCVYADGTERFEAAKKSGSLQAGSEATAPDALQNATNVALFPTKVEAPVSPIVAEANIATTSDPQITLVEDAASADTPTSARAQESSKTVATATVRVEIDRIDRLVNLVGELVINQAMLNQSVAALGLDSHGSVRSGLDEFLQLTRDIQDSVMLIRAQPIKTLFQRMGRIVREAASATNKPVRLVTDGDNTEIDKTVIEKLVDPLTHMIRNAVDHGLESSADRIAQNKPETGTIHLSATHRSGRVIIEISDDGAGLDRDRILQKALERRLIEPDAVLSEQEIDALLFLPGFSTSQTISALSGRGVGMDVVKRVIQSLGGRVSITSEPQKGTKFSISLPLTLAILDGMIVEVAGETLVIPLASISETLRYDPKLIERLDAQNSILQMRGNFYSLFDLGIELGFRKEKGFPENAIILLIHTEEDMHYALIVDRIIEQRQVVIKGLQDSYGKIQGISAATILGDGQIALILDPIELRQTAIGLAPELYYKELSAL